MKMKKTIISATILVGVLIALAAGFVAGQMYEAKQRLKYDLQYARHMYRYVEKDNIPDLIGALEASLLGKSLSMRSALDSPSQLLLYSFTERRVASDSAIRDLIAEVEVMRPAFTNMMMIGEQREPEQGAGVVREPRDGSRAPQP